MYVRISLADLPPWVMRITSRVMSTQIPQKKACVSKTIEPSGLTSRM